MRLRYLLLSLSISLAFPGNGQAAGEAPWPSAIWNPVPLADDVVLPLPCGGALALRPVATHRVDRNSPESLLSDKEIQLGRGDTKYGFVDYIHEEHLAGPFSSPQGDHYFLVGKYELTSEQYDAVMKGTSGACPAAPSTAGFGYPKIDISWYDAIEFSRRLNKWLYATAQTALPRAGSAVGYVRLPTEAEWEFTARGGLSVSDAVRISEADTLQPALLDYAWYSDTQLEPSVRRIGKKKPNPLGIFDMLGNAEELTLDSFQMNKVGRRHGQLGGIVLRGGSIRETDESIRFSSRKELPIMSPDAKDETRSSTIGMRIAIGAVAIHNDSEITRLIAEFQSASRQNVQNAAVQPLQEMENLLKRQNDDNSRRMQQLTAELRAEFRRRNELEVRATSAILREAVRILAEIESRASKIRGLEDNLKSDMDAPLSISYTQELKDTDIKQDRDAIDHEVAGMLSISPVYRDDLHVLTYEFFGRVPEASTQLSGFYSAGHRQADITRLEIVVRQINEYRANRVPTDRDLLRSAVGNGAWTK